MRILYFTRDVEVLIYFGFKQPCSIHLTLTVFWQMLSIDCGLGTWLFSIFTANRSFLLYMYICCSFGLVSARLVDFPSKSPSLQALPINVCLIHQSGKPRPPSETWRAKERSPLIIQLSATSHSLSLVHIVVVWSGLSSLHVCLLCIIQNLMLYECLCLPTASGGCKT